MASVYVATSLENAKNAKQIISMFIDNDIDITYDWTVHGRIDEEHMLGQIGKFELDGVLSADLLFMMQPARQGTHVEMGVALAANKKIILVQDGLSERKTFYYLPNVLRFDDQKTAFDKALEILR